MTSADLSPPPATSAPVFGRRTEEPGKGETRSFGIEVEYRKRGKVVREDMMLTAHLKLDAGAVLRFMQAGGDEVAQAQATAFVLATSLIDYDGVPSDWTRPPEDEPALVDEDDEDSEPERGDPTPEDPDGPLLYERWDGELVEYDELTFDEFTDGSSRRRFAYVTSSTRYRMELEGLNETARWLIAQAGGRPTKRLASSGRGPRSTRRGSGGR